MVELVAVAVLLGILSTIMFGTLDGIITSRDNLLNRNKASTTARSVIERITRELSNRMPGINLAATDSGDQTASGGPTAPNQRQSQFKGVNKGSGASAKDSIQFISSGTAQAAYGAFANTGVVEISYSLVEDPEQSIEMENGEKTYLLIRNEIPADVRDKKTRESLRITFPIAANVTSLNFRYLHDEAWVDDWSDGKRNRPSLPHAVEITLAIAGEDGRLNKYRTAVAVNRRSPRRSIPPTPR